VKENTDEHILDLLNNQATYERGFRLLMQAYQEPLYKHVRRLVIHHDDANDVIQNTFIKIFRNIERFEGKSNGSYVAQSLKADTFFDGDDIQKKLLQALATLPDKQKAVFNLRYYDEMPYEEMSQVLDTSVGALKASYHHAVKKVEAFFKGVEMD
jgi:RNA polymerase sigma-70 factor, ECF subfamily